MQLDRRLRDLDEVAEKSWMCNCFDAETTAYVFVLARIHSLVGWKNVLNSAPEALDDGAKIQIRIRRENRANKTRHYIFRNKFFAHTSTIVHTTLKEPVCVCVCLRGS